MSIPQRHLRFAQLLHEVLSKRWTIAMTDSSGTPDVNSVLRNGGRAMCGNSIGVRPNASMASDMSENEIPPGDVSIPMTSDEPCRCSSFKLLLTIMADSLGTPIAINVLRRRGWHMSSTKFNWRILSICINTVSALLGNLPDFTSIGLNNGANQSSSKAKHRHRQFRSSTGMQASPARISTKPLHSQQVLPSIVSLTIGMKPGTSAISQPCFNCWLVISLYTFN